MSRLARLRPDFISADFILFYLSIFIYFIIFIFLSNSKLGLHCTSLRAYLRPLLTIHRLRASTRPIIRTRSPPLMASFVARPQNCTSCPISLHIGLLRLPVCFESHSILACCFKSQLWVYEIRLTRNICLVLPS